MICIILQIYNKLILLLKCEDNIFLHYIQLLYVVNFATYIYISWTQSDQYLAYIYFQI